jgi:hypothetical protein
MSVTSAMSPRRRRVAAAAAPAAAAALILGLTAGTAASAASVAAPSVSLAVSSESCGSSSVWLRLWASSGEHCYTGSGSLQVSLAGVNREQILGSHEACLQSATKRSCLAGPASAAISPPITVTEITLSS